jgi:hypothetical protein
LHPLWLGTLLQKLVYVHSTGGHAELLHIPSWSELFHALFSTTV